MKLSLLVLKIAWVLMQGMFLPLVLLLDDLRVSGNYGAVIGIFLLLEILYVVDTVMFLVIFKGSK